MGKLTTHVLDVTNGIPAAGVRIELHSFATGAAERVIEVVTGNDGRCVAALLEAAAFQKGRYSLTFHVADYFRSRGAVLPDPPFIDEAVIRFGIAAPEQHYHVPLLITPWSYSVYRGG
jgi:5-hydroxyisourate hydrolase